MSVRVPGADARPVPGAHAMRVSKRLGIVVVSKAGNVGLTWFAILKAAESPEAASSIAAIAASCIAAMIAATWKYVGAETDRPSAKRVE